MSTKTLRNLLLSGVVLASAGVAASAQAQNVTIFDPSEFSVIESAGQYTVFNNSTDWYIYGFGVSNTQPGPLQPSTTQDNWYAFTCGSCLGNTTGFMYYNSDGSDPASFGFAIGPGQSSNKFFFDAPAQSHYEIYVTNAGQDLQTASGEATLAGAVPEPGVWALSILGFGMMGGALRRRRAEGAAVLA